MMNLRGGKCCYRLVLMLAFFLFIMKIFDGKGWSAPIEGKENDWRIAIAAGPISGSLYPQGAAVANVLKLNGVVSAATGEATAGAQENVRLLGAGKVTLGIVAVPWVGMAAKGAKPFDRKYDLRTVLPTQMASEFFITLKKSSINKINDLRGKRISVGLRSSGMDLHAQTILGALGITYKDIKPVYLGFAEGANALRDGKVDAQLMDGLPNPAMTELSELADVKVIKFSEEEMKKVVKPGSDYAKYFLEPGVFRGLTERTMITATASGLVTMANADSELIYAVTKCLLENSEELIKRATMMDAIRHFLKVAKEGDPQILELPGAPLHPGAYRAYKELGVIK